MSTLFRVDLGMVWAPVVDGKLPKSVCKLVISWAVQLGDRAGPEGAGAGLERKIYMMISGNP